MEETSTPKAAAYGEPPVVSQTIRTVLDAARVHLGMNTAFLGEFVNSRVVAMTFQSIVDLTDLEIVGVEASARFAAEPVRSPDAWFADELGMSLELQMTAPDAAFAALDQLPAKVYLTVNVSAETACSGELAVALAGLGCPPIVPEITEHQVVANYANSPRPRSVARQWGAPNS